jgi:hypothetical protein
MIMDKRRNGSGGTLGSLMQWVNKNLFLIFTMSGVIIGAALGKSNVALGKSYITLDKPILALDKTILALSKSKYSPR